MAEKKERGEGVERAQTNTQSAKEPKSQRAKEPIRQATCADLNNHVVVELEISHRDCDDKGNEEPNADNEVTAPCIAVLKVVGINAAPALGVGVAVGSGRERSRCKATRAIDSRQRPVLSFYPSTDLDTLVHFCAID